MPDDRARVILRLRLWLFEWFTATRPPGRRVRVRFGGIEVERLFGPVCRPRTGGQMRRAGWCCADDRLDRLRLHLPWPSGALMIMDIGREPAREHTT